jgi:peptidoglycan DL-endopeptidase CwlO
LSTHPTGRHRAPVRPTVPQTFVTSALSRSGQPAVRATAVLAASGGLLASLAVPASAAPMSDSSAQAAPSSADTVAVAAPTTELPVVAPSFGEVGFTGVAPAPPKPAPKPVSHPAPAPIATPGPTPRTSVSSSRGTSRPTLTVHVASATAGVLGIASGFAGVPYVWGGTTPQGFDCSGFTQYVFAKLGKSLPRTAEDQRQAVSRVSSPQPGDLVFFGSPAYHVGIYAGGGMMWDAPHTGAVVSKRAVWASSDISYGRP